MTTLHKAAREALEALENFVNDIVPTRDGDPLWADGRAALATLRAALSEAPGEEPVAAPLDAGPWEAGECKDGRVYVQSDDFTHDVRLYVTGDFASEQQHMDYARWVADVMTRAARHSAPTVALTDEQIVTLAHRMAWRYKHSHDQHHSDTYTFNRACLVAFVRAIGKEGGA